MLFFQTSFFIWISLENINDNFRNFSEKFVVTIYVEIMFWLGAKFSFEEWG